MVVPAPLEVDAAMKQIRRGRLTTIDAIRTALAQKHGTTIACPMTTGIFAWIAAHAADEAEKEGRKRITPYWRTLKSDGEINPKYPRGVSALGKILKAEGHELQKKGRRLVVVSFDKKLARSVMAPTYARAAA